MSRTAYLGDSVYVAFDGNGLVLTTEDGMEDGPTNTIYLESEVYRALMSFVARLREE